MPLVQLVARHIAQSWPLFTLNFFHASSNQSSNLTYPSLHKPLPDWSLQATCGPCGPRSLASSFSTPAAWIAAAVTVPRHSLRIISSRPNQPATVGTATRLHLQLQNCWPHNYPGPREQLSRKLPDWHFRTRFVFKKWWNDGFLADISHHRNAVCQPARSFMCFD